MSVLNESGEIILLQAKADCSLFGMEHQLMFCLKVYMCNLTHRY